MSRKPMDDRVLNLVSRYLTPQDIRTTCSAVGSGDEIVDHLKFALKERNPDGVQAISNMHSYPDRPGGTCPLPTALYMREFEPDRLRFFIVNNNMLDPRTKVRLLLNVDKALTNWFSRTFLESSPKVCKSSILDLIINAIHAHGTNGELDLIGQYRLVLMGTTGIRVYKTISNLVVAFSSTRCGSVCHIEDNIVGFMTSKFVFTTSIELHNNNKTKAS